MINYSYPLYRPPAEANNLILQVTHGCSYNHCSFCSMYKTKNYEVRSLEAIYHDIDILAHNTPHARRVFLADGDALSLDTSYLLEIFIYLKKSFPKLNRISLYASTQNIHYGTAILYFKSGKINGKYFTSERPILNSTIQRSNWGTIQAEKIS